MEKDKCLGCENNFYNGNNNLNIAECWSLKTATMIKRKKVGINDVPPWTWKPQLFPSCYRQKGYVFIHCEDEDRQY